MKSQRPIIPPEVHEFAAEKGDEVQIAFAIDGAVEGVQLGEEWVRREWRIPAAVWVAGLFTPDHRPPVSTRAEQQLWRTRPLRCTSVQEAEVEATGPSAHSVLPARMSG